MKTLSLKKIYKDVDFSLRIDYTNTDIFFRDDKLEMEYSELASVCTLKSFCENVGLMSDVENYPALTNYTKNITSSLSFDDYLKQMNDPRDYLKVYHNASSAKLKITGNNRDQKYLMTSSMFSRRFVRANSYVLLMKLKTREASAYIKKISIISHESNPKFETIEMTCNIIIFLTSLIIFIFCSIDLTNKRYSEWMSVNKSLLRIIIVQILGSGIISLCLDIFGSKYTEPMVVFETFFQSLQVILDFSLFISGFFFAKRLTSGIKTLKNVAIGIIGVCYIGKKFLKIASDGFPELEILTDTDAFVSHYLFLVTIFFYVIVLILVITFVSELSNNNGANTDKFTTILNLISFISLTIYLIGELIYELGLTDNTVFSIFATRINLCFFNCFMLVLSTPLSGEEESELLDDSEKKRKEFGSELKVSNIDHLDKYNPQGSIETGYDPEIEDEGYGYNDDDFSNDDDDEDYEEDFDEDSNEDFGGVVGDEFEDDFNAEFDIDVDVDVEDEDYSVSEGEEEYDYHDRENLSDSEDSD